LSDIYLVEIYENGKWRLAESYRDDEEYYDPERFGVGVHAHPTETLAESSIKNLLRAWPKTIARVVRYESSVDTDAELQRLR